MAFASRMFFAFAIFSVFLMQSFALAATANETALLYVATGEASATKSVQFQSGGSTYYVVTVANKEVLLLKPEGSDFTHVSDNATLLSVLPAYISAAYASAFSDTNLESLKNHFDALNKTYAYCDEAMTPFLKNSFLIYYIQQIDDRGTPIPKTKLALDGLMGNKTLGEGTQAKLKNGFGNASEKISALSSGMAPDELRQSLSELSDLFAVLKNASDQYAADFNLLESRHPDMLKKRVCALSSTSFANVTDDLSIRDNIPSSQQLSSSIIASTPQRVELRKVKELVSEESAKFKEVSDLFSEVKKKLDGKGISLTGLNKSVASLDATLTSLKATSTLSSAKTLQATFDTNYNSTKAWLVALSATTLATDIVSSVDALKEAKNSTSQAALRLGENNEDVMKIKQKIKTLETSLNTQLGLVQNASNKTVAPAVFQNMTITANAIAKEANDLKPAWDQNILIIIAGAVVIIALVFAIVIWYRNQKTLAELSDKVSKSAEKEIDIRKLK